jgi:hypothetical protein
VDHYDIPPGGAAVKAQEVFAARIAKRTRPPVAGFVARGDARQSGADENAQHIAIEAERWDMATRSRAEQDEA